MKRLAKSPMLDFRVVKTSDAVNINWNKLISMALTFLASKVLRDGRGFDVARDGIALKWSEMQRSSTMVLETLGFSGGVMTMV